MIVRTARSSLLLISQPDHAALAGRVMAEWRADGLPASPRRRTILRATAEHDNGWRELDAAPIVDPESGEIQDFMNAPAALRRAVWPRGAIRLADEPWCAALVAQHALHVYARHRSNAEWAGFFAQMEALRDRFLQQAAPLEPDDLFRDYHFVRLGDLISLTFCNGWTEPQTDLGGYVIRLEEDRIRVAPDPFDGREVPIEIRAAALPNRAVTSAADASEQFARAPTVVLTGRVLGEKR